MVNFATPTIRLEEEEEEEEEPIDNHPICPSNHTQSSRRQQIKRLAQGIRAFIITPIGIIITIYAILVVFWVRIHTPKKTKKKNSHSPISSGRRIGLDSLGLDQNQTERKIPHLDRNL